MGLHLKAKHILYKEFIEKTFQGYKKTDLDILLSINPDEIIKKKIQLDKISDIANDFKLFTDNIKSENSLFNNLIKFYFEKFKFTTIYFHKFNMDTKKLSERNYISKNKKKENIQINFDFDEFNSDKNMLIEDKEYIQSLFVNTFEPTLIFPILINNKLYGIFSFFNDINSNIDTSLLNKINQFLISIISLNLDNIFQKKENDLQKKYNTKLINILSNIIKIQESTDLKKQLLFLKKYFGINNFILLEGKNDKYKIKYSNIKSIKQNTTLKINKKINKSTLIKNLKNNELIQQVKLNIPKKSNIFYLNKIDSTHSIIILNTTPKFHQNIKEFEFIKNLFFESFFTNLKSKKKSPSKISEKNIVKQSVKQNTSKTKLLKKKTTKNKISKKNEQKEKSTKNTKNLIKKPSKKKIEKSTKKQVKKK